MAHGASRLQRPLGQCWGKATAASCSPALQMSPPHTPGEGRGDRALQEASPTVLLLRQLCR